MMLVLPIVRYAGKKSSLPNALSWESSFPNHTVFLLHRSILLSLIHIYNTHILYLSSTSQKPLYFVSLLPPLFPNLSPSIASMFLQSLSAICSLFARYLFSLIPNIYRTTTGHLPNMNMSCSLAASLLNWGYLLLIFEMFL